MRVRGRAEGYARVVTAALWALIGLSFAPLFASDLGPGPEGLAAQERRDTVRTDTLRTDTLQTARDSAQARVRQRLEALARPPGVRSDPLPGDTLGPAGQGAARGGRRTGLSRQRGATLPPGDEITNALMELPGYRVTRYSAVAAAYDAEQELLFLYGSLGAPDAAPARDTLTTEQADSVLAVADSLRVRADSLGSLLADTAAVPVRTREVIIERMDSLQALSDSLRGLAQPGAEAEVVRATLSTSEGGRIEAERYIRFDQRRETAEARGDPTVILASGEEPTEADSLNIDLAGERASAFEARTTYQQGGGTNWNVRGDLPYVGQGLVYGRHTRFTSCDLEVPHYHFETDNLKIVQGRIMVARPVRLYFADVPVAWLPFVAQSLAQGRASGLLTPRFSVNDIVRTSGGYRRRLSNLGFYWAMSEYSDATLAVDWWDDTYTALTGSLRFSWLRQFMDASFNVRQYWRESGTSQFSLDSQARWQPSERSNFTSSIRYTSSTDFLRQHSLDPREVTGQVTSSGGYSHRFDWGTVNVSGTRTQSLSNDVVTLNLPSVGLSLSSLTFFPAPPARAAWYNNLSWNGGARFSRTLVDHPADTAGFSFSSSDQLTTSASVSSGFNLGDFSLTQQVGYTEGTTRAIPRDSLIFFPETAARLGLRAFDTPLGRAYLAQQQGEENPGELVDVADARLNWSTTLDYTRNLIGSTTFTPRLSISGESVRKDTVDVAQSFVSSPAQLTFGAQLKADVYGFYGGFSDFEAVRHKVTSSLQYDWSPEVEPSELQARVLNSRAIRPKSAVSISLNQTWEAKRRSEEPDTAAADTAAVPADSAAAGAPAGERVNPDDEPAGIDTTPRDLLASDAGAAGDETGPRRLEQGQIVNLLSLRTSAVRYDFVEADSIGDFLSGFQNTTLDNTISSDFLRGLSIRMSHDLFEEAEEGEGDGVTSRRSFAPHLKSLNFGFSLDPNSSLFRVLGLGGDDGPDDFSDQDDLDLTEDEPFPQRSATDETTILPGRGTDQDVREERRPNPSASSGVDWNARFSYSLNRPRDDDRETSQMLQISLDLNPTSQWEMSWDTAYDLERGAFNDHRVRLTRDLHRWQAHFDFYKTTTGNWTFRFEVSLLDNQDLHFDYEQRNIEGLSGGRR